MVPGTTTVGKKNKGLKARTLALLAAATVGLGVGGVTFIRSAGPHLPPVQVSRATPGTFLKTVTSSGTVKPEVSRTLAFVGSGNVAQLSVKLGDTVYAGQKLARLDTANTERDLVAARAALRSAETDLARAGAASAETERDLHRQVANAESAVQAAQAALADTERALALQSRLVEAGVTSAQEQRAARNARDDARRKLEAAERDLTFNRLKSNTGGTSLQSARSALEAARVRVQNLVKSLQDAQLYAPVGGVVSAVNINVGTPAPTNQPAIEVTDPHRLYLEIQFDETRAAELRPGQPAEVKFDALPRQKFTGTVDRVAPVARESGQVAAVLVRVRLHDPGRVKPGFTGTATVITRRIQEAMTVPLEATREAGGETTVWRVTPQQAGATQGAGKAEALRVTIIDRNASAAAVNGLQGNDLIITPAPEDLKSGSDVQFTTGLDNLGTPGHPASTTVGGGK